MLVHIARNALVFVVAEPVLKPMLDVADPANAVPAQRLGTGLGRPLKKNLTAPKPSF